MQSVEFKGSKNCQNCKYFYTYERQCDGVTQRVCKYWGADVWLAVAVDENYYRNVYCQGWSGDLSDADVIMVDPIPGKMPGSDPDAVTPQDQ